MEILSDTIFRGNVEIIGHNQLSVSEFELGSDKIKLYYGANVETRLRPGIMATTDQIDYINSSIAETNNYMVKSYSLSNLQIPPNCTRFYFSDSSGKTKIVKRNWWNLSYPIFQVVDIHASCAYNKLVQMDIEYTCSDDHWIFIGNIADHSEAIDATEIILSVLS